MTHPKEAVEAVAWALRQMHHNAMDMTPLRDIVTTDIARALIGQIAPMLTADLHVPDIGCVYCGFHDLQAALDRAEAEAREAALQYLSDTGQMMDRIAAIEADKAAAVEAMREACAEVAEEQKQRYQNLSDAPRQTPKAKAMFDVLAGAAVNIAAAIRALPPPPAARGQDVEALVQAAQGVIARWDSPDWKSGHTLDHITKLRAALAPFTGGKAC